MSWYGKAVLVWGGVLSSGESRHVMVGYVGDLSDLVRWTVDGDPSGLPCKQCWFRPYMPFGCGRVMWDVRYLFVDQIVLGHVGSQRARHAL